MIKEINWENKLLTPPPCTPLYCFLTRGLRHYFEKPKKSSSVGESSTACYAHFPSFPDIKKEAIMKDNSVFLQMVKISAPYLFSFEIQPIEKKGVKIAQTTYIYVVRSQHVKRGRVLSTPKSNYLKHMA